MVDHTIGYFSHHPVYIMCFIQYNCASSYVIARFIFQCIVAPSFILVIFNYDVVPTSISCIFL